MYNTHKENKTNSGRPNAIDELLIKTVDVPDIEKAETQLSFVQNLSEKKRDTSTTHCSRKEGRKNATRIKRGV